MWLEDEDLVTKDALREVRRVQRDKEFRVLSQGETKAILGTTEHHPLGNAVTCHPGSHCSRVSTSSVSNGVT